MDACPHILKFSPLVVKQDIDCQFWLSVTPTFFFNSLTVHLRKITSPKWQTYFPLPQISIKKKKIIKETIIWYITPNTKPKMLLRKSLFALHFNKGIALFLYL